MTNTPTPAQWCTEPGDNHSSDQVTVYRGHREPARWCGYHAHRNLPRPTSNSTSKEKRP